MEIYFHNPPVPYAFVAWRRTTLTYLRSPSALMFVCDTSYCAKRGGMLPIVRKFSRIGRKDLATSSRVKVAIQLKPTA